MFWRTHGFINLKTCVRTQNLAFLRKYTFRMKSTESFIHEAPGDLRKKKKKLKKFFLFFYYKNHFF